MRTGIVASLLALSLYASASAAVPERLVISTTDEALGRAIVRSANQHVAGPIELLPRGATPPLRVLRLQVLREGSDRIRLVLSREPRHSVVQILKITGQHGPFDLAEAVALAISDLQARLEELTQSALRPAAVVPTRDLAMGMRPIVPRSPVPLPEPVRAKEPPHAPTEADEIEPDPLTGPDPEPKEPSIESLRPGETTIRSAARPLEFRIGAAQPDPQLVDRVPLSRWRFHLAAGISMEALGLGLLGLGAASLVMDGQCTAPSCEYRFDGRTAGSVELALGGTALLAGTALLVAVEYQHRRLSSRLITTASRSPFRSFSRGF